MELDDMVYQVVRCLACCGKLWKTHKVNSFRKENDGVTLERRQTSDKVEGDVGPGVARDRWRVQQTRRWAM